MLYRSWSLLALSLGLGIQGPASSGLPDRVHCPGDGFGTSTAFLDDWNGDGVEEIGIGSPREFVVGRGYVGGLRMIDGRTLRLILRIEGPCESFVAGDHGDRFGCRVALADDLDGDGIREFSVLARAGRTPRLEDGRRGPWRGRSSVFVLSSSANAGVVHSYENVGWDCAEEFGFTGFNPGDERLGLDVTGDGVREILVPLGGELGDTAALSGSDRRPLFNLRAYPFDERDRGEIDNYEFGWDHCGVADLTGDGVPDFLVGAGGYVCLYSGLDGAFVRDLVGWEVDPSKSGEPSRGFGRVVAGVERHAVESEGDRLPAFLVAAPAPSDEDCRLDGEVWVFDRRMEPIERLDRDALDQGAHRVLRVGSRL